MRHCNGADNHLHSVLATPTDILVLHLKRFTFEKCPKDGRLLRRKIEDKVDFPIDRLDLSSYILGPNHGDAPPIYKVMNIVLYASLIRLHTDPVFSFTAVVWCQ